MADAFERLMARLDYPMLLVTAASGGSRAGCLVGFYTQTSIHPQRLLIGLSDKNYTTRVAADADALCVHLLLRENRALAELFGGETGDEVDKFERCDWHHGPEGVPVVEGTAGFVVGRVLERARLGDHIGHVLESLHAELGRDGELLRFSEVREMEPGHEA